MNVNMTLRNALEWRLIGPHRGGRVVAVAGDPSDRLVFYFGSTGGGVWKTTDGAVTWSNVSDGFFRTASVGAIAVAPSDPNLLYVGMGEATIRGNVSYGDGVYKSTDRGQTWSHLGLAETRHIAKIRVHPKDPDLVYVAAFGHAFGPHPERGLYRSKDGGQTWQQILFRDEWSGAIDLSMDPNNPRILYAATWQASRSPWSLSSGGPGSALYRSRDGGDTWTEISHHPGLPVGLLGKIGVAVSPATRDRVWALIEAEDGGLFRSDDGGETWELVSADSELRQRPWYYMHVIADPLDAETVWVLNLKCWKSTDGGRTFVGVDMPHVDNHDLWIDPNDSRRMIEGSDGGACVTFSGGPPWSSLYNQPTAEFYHVTADERLPYRVYGSQQDNTAISIPSFSSDGAITQAEWYEPGGGESGYIAIHPHDPNIVYAGSYSGTITRYDHRARQYQDITVWPENPTGWGAIDLKYRFNWTFPLAISPHDPEVVYAGGNHLFRTTSGGMRWEIASPDLSRNDPQTLQSSGGPITKDNVSTENYGTIFAFAESPLERGILWTGSDDGLVHVSRDNGQTWRNVTPPDLPEWAMISIIDASPHDPAGAYVAATRYKSDDPRPYLYKTADFGKTWTGITGGIPDHDFTRVIRADPHRRGLLYAGTETGMYVSFDDGARWERLQLNLPVVPVHDLMVKGTDLLAASHGRSLWILDDVTPLYSIVDDLQRSEPVLFRPRLTYRYKVYWGPGPIPQGTYARAGTLVVTYRKRMLLTGEMTEDFLDAGKNPPNGVIVYYYLPATPDAEVTLRFLDESGHVIRSFSSNGTGGPAGDRRAPWVSVTAGLNRFVWDMHHADASEVKGTAFWAGGIRGPLVAPGRYQVELRIGDASWRASFDIVKDPRVAATDVDLQTQAALLLQIRDTLSDTHNAVNGIRDIRGQLQAWSERSDRVAGAQALNEAGDAIRQELVSIEEELIQVRVHAPYDTLKFPIQLNNKLAALAGVVARADAAPTQQSLDTFDSLRSQVAARIDRLNALIETELTDFNNQARELGVPLITPPAG